MDDDSAGDAASTARPRMEPNTGSAWDGGLSSSPAADGEFAQLEWRGVSQKLAWHRFVTILATLVAVGGVGVVVAIVWLPPAALLVWGGVVLGAAVVALAYSRAAANRWCWAEGATDLVIAYGVLVRQVVMVPYGRIQVVDVTVSPVEQWLGIATVRVHTAATTIDACVCGLTETEATQLRTRLANRSETFTTGL
ncbi:PH domain-containing protein [Lipingzhangella sp. LS1_29]|uniref:PH domain-containing protein n=1 Tax=Lipingzhangella rawalii TaxID=2055835 RepID=A0ABU2H9G7_9ACTN|nr:PH domain-containing protein [Lipingzhangella rawalii]MDS1271921.1 PH domain-containing protein [Lipingzhangella rawalii]